MSNAIVNRQTKEKQALIEQLKKTPIVQIACERTGVGRATYYRWRKEDVIFAKSSNEAIAEGNFLVNDLAESHLISAIKENNLGAIIFWLKHHHSTYATRVELTTSNQNHEITLTEKQKELLNKALEMAALIPHQKEDNE